MIIGIEWKEECGLRTTLRDRRRAGGTRHSVAPLAGFVSKEHAIPRWPTAHGPDSQVISVRTTLQRYDKNLADARHALDSASKSRSEALGRSAGRPAAPQVMSAVFICPPGPTGHAHTPGVPAYVHRHPALRSPEHWAGHATGADIVGSRTVPNPLHHRRRQAVGGLLRIPLRAAACPHPSIVGRLSPHSLRRTTATLPVEEGDALHHLKDSTGHADPRTTRRYDRARGKQEKSSAYVARVLV
jgi:hypothetical protein